MNLIIKERPRLIRVIAFLLTLFALLGEGDCYYRPYDSFVPDQRYLGSPWPDSSRGYSRVFRSAKERRATTSAENATTLLVIQQVAETAKEATDLARDRYEELKTSYMTVCRSPLQPTMHDERSWTVKDARWGRQVDTDDTSIYEDHQVATHVNLMVTFTDLHALHRFVYRISTTARDYVVMPRLTWGLKPETQTQVNKDLEDEAHQNIKFWMSEDYAAQIGVDAISKEDCSSSVQVAGRYMSMDGKRFDFWNWNSIQEYFNEEPDVSGTRIGEVTTWVVVKCAFRAVKHSTADLMRQAAEKVVGDAEEA